MVFPFTLILKPISNNDRNDSRGGRNITSLRFADGIYAGELEALV